MDDTKPIKVTLNIFGVSVKAAFTRNKHDYEAKISKRTAIRCYNATVNRLVQNDIPKDTDINVRVSTCAFPTYGVHLIRYWNADDYFRTGNPESGYRNRFIVNIDSSYSEGTITASHNMFDWLRAQKKQKMREQLGITDNRKIESEKNDLLQLSEQ
jgi:hypothetical protein